MDVEEIRELEKVVERLAASGPSKVRAPHCWFCGKIEAWFLCDCPEAREAQSGKRTKPRFDAKLGAMILDEEIIQRNLDRGFGRRYEPPPANAVAANSSPANAPVSTDRKAYQRELMRKRRAEDRERRAEQKAPE